MNNSFKLRIFLTLSVFVTLFAGMARGADSAFVDLGSARDTQRLSILVKMFDDSIVAGRMKRCEAYLKQAGNENKKIKSAKYELVLALRNSWLFYRKGEFQSAFDKAENAKALAEQQKDDRSLAQALNYLGMNRGRLGDVAKALPYYQKALDLYTNSNYEKGCINVLTNIAGIYFDEGDFATAITYFEKSLAIAKKLGDKKQIGSSLNNIGSAYQNSNNKIKAEEYYLQAIAANLESGNEHALAYNYLNLAYCELDDHNTTLATEYNKKAMEIFTRFGDKYSVVGCLNQEADLLIEKHELAKALVIVKKAITMARSTGSPLLIQRTLRQAADVYRKNGDYKTASELLDQFIVTKDSIINDEIRNQVTQKQMSFEFDKKRLSDSLSRLLSEKELRQEIATRETKSKQQELLLIISLIVLTIFAALAALIFRSNSRNKKANLIISKQKEIADQQRQAIEYKNKEMVESISYAKHLQDAILPSDKMIRNIFPDSYVLYKPKDIVAGDFYWMETIGDTTLFAVADCTGHGVPGAMVSVVCSNALNRATKEFGITDPGRILDKVSVLVAETFEKSENDVMDGMDIALCSLKKEGDHFQLLFSGANNPLWLVREKKLMEYKGDKQPIGKFEKYKSFTTHYIDVKKGDTLCIFTDGYADQFGGLQKKKFKIKQLQGKIIDISEQFMEKQKEILENIFNEWKGDLDQIDDVCIVGIKI